MSFLYSLLAVALGLTLMSEFGLVGIYSLLGLFVVIEVVLFVRTGRWTE